MAEGLQGTLTQKLGPAPVWMWLVGGGIALWLVSRSGLLSGVLGSSGSSGAAATAQPATTSGATPSASDQQSAGAALSQEVGLLQQLQGFQQQSFQNDLQQVQQTQQTQQALNPPAQPPTYTAGSSNVGLQGFEQQHGAAIPLYSQLTQTTQGVFTPFSQTGTLPLGATVVSNGPPVQAPWPAPGGGQTTVSFIPFNYQGKQYWVSAADVTPSGTTGSATQGAASTGVGGPRIPAHFHSITGRSALGAADAIFRSGHPLLRAGGAGPLYPHYAMGGPRQIHQIGAMVGVHPARVLAANAGMRRGAAVPGQRVRIA